MIFHASIEADDPPVVAAAIARLWGAEAYPFPPVAEGSLIVLAGDHRNSAIEVYPRGSALYPTEADPVARAAANDRHGAVHLAIASPLEVAGILAIAAEQGWLAQRRNRGGMFDVVEVWVENCFIIEVLTPHMQAQYLASLTPDGWRAALAAGPRAAT